MTNFYTSLLLSSFAGLSTLIGFLGIYVKPKNRYSFISFSLSFSLAVMLCISLFDLIPESLKKLNASVAILGIIIFFIIFIVADKLFKIIDRAVDRKNEKTLYKVGLLSALVLFLHNIPEGILTFNTSYTNFHLGFKIALAIALHNIPEGIAVAIPVYYANMGKGRALFLTFVSGISEPIAGVLSFILIRNYINMNLIGMMMIFAASLMIFLSVFKLYPEVLTYKEKKSMYYGFVIGLILFIISNFILS